VTVDNILMFLFIHLGLLFHKFILVPILVLLQEDRFFVLVFVEELNTEAQSWTRLAKIRQPDYD